MDVMGDMVSIKFYWGYRYFYSILILVNLFLCLLELVSIVTIGYKASVVES